MHIKSQVKEFYRIIRRISHDRKYNSGEKIRYYNFWQNETAQEMWFTKFIHANKIEQTQPINFYSVLGPLCNLRFYRKGVNVFFSGENMHTELYAKCRQTCKHRKFDLYIDFDKTISERSIRFPLWLLFMFDPASSEEEIRKRVNQLRYPPIDNRIGFCSLVASHDSNGVRGEMLDLLSDVGVVSSGGAFKKNTDELHTLYKNNKHDFIKQYQLNICPENSNAEGYVTEKIFQAIDAGCIPLYWGANNTPEPNILNPDTILFWNKDGDNTQFFDVVKEIQKSPDSYRKYIEQPRLLPGAEDYILGMFKDLKLALSDVITSKK